MKNIVQVVVEVEFSASYIKQYNESIPASSPNPLSLAIANVAQRLWDDGDKNARKYHYFAY